jgi:anaerobic ribonucleoside-triphosphate reductase activating protein
MKLRVHRYLPHTHVEGPGERACIWVQGCPIHCPGCAVPQTWPAEGGTEYEVAELVGKILSGPAIEGISLMGGEPFFQAAALVELGELLRAQDLSIVTFTGYTLEEIKTAEREDWQALLAITDLLIDGPYIQELADYSRPWVGSSNQRYHFLTERYRYLEGKLEKIPNRLEIRVNQDGKIEINGMAPVAEVLEALKNL